VELGRVRAELRGAEGDETGADDRADEEPPQEGVLVYQ
jgi:hypothetical protein